MLTHQEAVWGTLPGAEGSFSMLEKISFRSLSVLSRPPPLVGTPLIGASRLQTPSVNQGRHPPCFWTLSRLPDG